MIGKNPTEDIYLESINTIYGFPTLCDNELNVSLALNYTLITGNTTTVAVVVFDPSRLIA